MSGDNEPADLELLDRYRRAGDAAPSQPSDAVREAILAEGRRAAARNTAPAAHRFDARVPAANRPRWRYAAIGTACAAALAAFLVVPRFLVQPREQAVVVQSFPQRATSLAPESASEAMPAQAAPAPTLGQVPSVASPPAVAQNSRAIEPYRRLQPEAPSAKVSSDALSADASKNPPSAFAEATTAGRASGGEALAQQRKSALVADASKSMTSRLSSDLRQITVTPEPAPQPNALAGVAATAQPASPPAASDLLAQRADATRAAGGKAAGDLEEVVVTQAKAANRPPTPLISAINWGRAQKAQMLLESGEGSTMETDAKGRTPLLRAVERRRVDLVQLLLAHGADPNAADAAGDTPLSLARQKKLTDIVALLEAAAKASP